MMKAFTLGWAIVYLIILLVNVYIWSKYWSYQFRNNRRPKIFVYFIIHFILVLISIYYFKLFFSGNTTSCLARLLSYIAGFYLTFINYSMLIYLFHDLVYSTRNLFKYPHKIKRFGYMVFFGGFLIFTLASGISVYGIYNADRFVEKKYELKLASKDSGLDNLNIVFLSDGHIGTSLNINNIGELVDRVNEINPDIVLLGGDFFDEGTSEEVKELVAKELGGLVSKYGIFAIEGNHEYKSGNSNIDQQMKYLSDQGIVVLQDKVVLVDQSFYIVGRKDSHGNSKRLEELMKEVDRNLPVIILDHRPTYRETEKFDSIDLQLSGHSHSGQIFPMQIFENISMGFTKTYIYGRTKRGNTSYIVSSGIGNWGIPIRIGSRREIVNVEIDFD